MKSSNEDNGFSLNKQPYGRSFRGGGSCYRCGKDGHKSRDCPLGGGGGGGGRSGQGGGTCYKCGELGHKSRDCPQDGASGGGKCYRCGETGHKSRDCPQGGATDRGGNCYKCGERGHKSRDCPQGGGSDGGGNCYKCGERGHKSRDCPQGGGSDGGGKCYKCGERGHKSRDCPQGGATDRGGNCYKCGERGHKSRDCPQGGGSDGGGKCYKCGESGHKMHQCSRGDASGGRGGVCYSCGKNGHKSRDCPQKVGEGGSGRGKCYKCGQEGHRMDACPTGAASKKLGPNVFIGFQVSNPHVYKELLEVQEELVRFDKDLEDHLIPIAKSHITLLVAQVEDENMEHAIQVVRKGVEKINAELMNKDVNVSFEGIGSFGSKIIFSNLVESLNDIKMMRDVFVDLFTKENINLPDLRFNAHLTIARVKRGNTTIPPEAYNCYKNHHFGTQQVKSVQLMSMSKEETENGYYYTEAEFMLNNFNEGCEDK